MRLLLLTLFAPSTADFAWEPSAPAYHATAALADSEDSASCCGCERVSDPAYGEDGLSCPCDATAGACDAGCCCDTSDCTASELAGCPSAGAPGGAGRAGVTYCSDLLARANIPQTAAARGWSDVTDLDGLLCVQTDNSESRGAFLSDPFPTCSALSSQEESDVLDHLRAEENVGNLTAFRQWLAPAAAAVSGDSRYTLGAPVLGDGCVDAVDDAGCSRRAPLLLPARGPSGACEGSQLVPYLTDTAPYACNTPAAMPIAELCAGWLNATVLLRQKVASSPVSSDAALALSYLLYNTTTGAYDAVDAPPAGASFIPPSPSTPPTTLSPATCPPTSSPPHPSSPLAARLVTPPRKNLPPRSVSHQRRRLLLGAHVARVPPHRLRGGKNHRGSCVPGYRGRKLRVGGRRRRAEPCARVRAPRRASDLATDLGTAGLRARSAGAHRRLLWRCLRTSYRRAAAAAARRARAVQH